MSHEGSDSFVWTCPGCGRQVPKRIRKCRCGVEHEEPAQPPASPEDSRAPARVPWGAIWGGTTLLLVVLLLMRWSSPPESPSDRLSPLPATEPPVEASALAPTEPSAPGPATEAIEARTQDGGGAVPAQTGSPAPLEDVISAAIPAIVSIESPTGRGTGFFAAPGVVVTNEHVVSGTTGVTLMTADGTVRARVAISAPEFDLAILRLATPQPSHAVLPMGSVTTARVGQEVIAIGFALGLLENTVTRGIVSAIRQAGSVTFLQTDAAINPGNSGGPLIDSSGQVIGINTLRFGEQAESLGFAVAIDHVKPLLDGDVPPTRRSARPAANDAFAPLFSRSQPSTADRIRIEGEAAFQQTLVAVAARATEIDDYWDRFVAACLPGPPAAGTYDRGWFRLYEGSVSIGVAPSQCAGWLGDLDELAQDVHSTMMEVEEAARRAGVYPGVRRILRRNYELDWRGWER